MTRMAPARPGLPTVVTILIISAIFLASFFIATSIRDIGSISVTEKAIICAIIAIALGSIGHAWSKQRRDLLRELTSARVAVRDARKAVEQEAFGNETAKARSELQESAISLHVIWLQVDINALRRRAFWAFVLGLAICLGSLSAPYAAYVLANKPTGVWQYFIGGSTLAALLLGVGGTLLRHDNKIREQARMLERERLYFSRLETGLGCARSLGTKEYEQGLAAVVGHLLAAPPVLGGLSSGPEPEAVGEKSPLVEASKVTSMVATIAKKATGSAGSAPDAE